MWSAWIIKSHFNIRDWEGQGVPYIILIFYWYSMPAGIYLYYNIKIRKSQLNSMQGSSWESFKSQRKWGCYFLGKLYFWTYITAYHAAWRKLSQWRIMARGSNICSNCPLSLLSTPSSPARLIASFLKLNTTQEFILNVINLSIVGL